VANVIKKKERLRSLHKNVVDAVIDQVASDRVVCSGSESDLEFGADSVRGCDQHRPRIFGNAPSNIPPNEPISESVRSLKVARASSLIFSVARFAASISTPAAA
jgi:hypothetical protein